MKGQILKVDLSNRSHQVETLPGGILRKYLGGRGLGAYLLNTTVSPHIDPLSEENHLIFSAGPANGTGMPQQVRLTEPVCPSAPGQWSPPNRL
jgi:aldehyde:ferredoxin oxidoreductase